MNGDEAYKEICRLAREHALVWQAYGGIVTIVHPDTQKSEGIYDHIQFTHGLGKHPETLKRESDDYTDQRMREAENHGQCDKYQYE